jgi:diacylglycerol kinase family enzyme
VAEQLLRSGKGKNISFGLVPAGTGSDLARGLRLPTRPVPALRHLLSCQPRPFDLIRLRRDSGEERLSINVASAGVSGAVALAVNARPNRGQIPYLRATIQALFRYQPTPCRIWVDGELFYQGDFFVLAVANGRFFGKGMQVAPQGRTDDGLAEVVLVPPLPLWQLPYRLPLFIAGQHPRWAGVLHTRARSLRIEPMGDMPPFELDGETLAAGPAELTLLPGALRILA